MKYLNLLKNLFKHELVSGSFFVFAGTLVSSFLAFVLNVYFARELSYADYGTLSSLISIVTLLTIPAGAISVVIVRYATLFFARGEEDRAGAFYIKSFKYILIYSFILNVIFIILFPVISNFLKISDIGLIVLVALSVALFYLATLNIAFLQSLLKFRLLGFIYFIAGIGKLIGGIALVYLGFRVYGAILATFIFSLIDYVFSLVPLRKTISNAGKEVSIGTKDFTSYAIPTTIALFSLSSFISTDVLLVKHFFTGVEAGFYGGLSLVGKVIFYFTGPIPMVMFPLIVKKHENSEKYHKLFYASLVLVLIPSVSITIFYFLFPEFTIKLFLGGKGYLTMAPYLGLFGVFLTIFSINNVFINFFLSIKKTLVWGIVLIWSVAQIGLIILIHDNFYQIIYINIITSVLLLVFLVLYYLKVHGFSKPNKATI